MGEYCPIHNHSEYSNIDGLSTTREIGQRVTDLGYEAVGLSDHGTVSGHLDFAKEMQSRDIKPIFACELYHGINPDARGAKRDQAHFLAGAMTDEGLKNLWRLVDKASTNFFHVGRVTWDMLDQYSEGLFATSACIQSLVCQELLDDKLDALNRYLRIFRDNFYIELHTYPAEDQWALNIKLAQVAQERGIPVTIANDAHFAFPEQYEIHDTYLAMKMRENVYMDPADRKMWHPNGLYIQSVDEIRANLSHLPDSVVDEGLRNTVDIAERVAADLPQIRRHLPTFIPKQCPWIEDPPEKASVLFIDLVEEGLVRRYGEDAPQEVWDRATQEMEVFLEAGLEHYFLQAWDFCQFCDANNIKRGPGRGSAAGAIVAYAMGITDVDPLRYGLIFERFYNPGREKGFPDIDNDFPRESRKKVKGYLSKRWGDSKVRTIGTIGYMKPKAACDATHLACSVTYSENDAVKAIIQATPDLEILGMDSIGWSKELDPGKTIYVEDHVGGDLKRWVKSQPKDRQPYLERWLEVVKIVCGRIEKYGVHPSGVVVSDGDLGAELPCRWVPAKDMQMPVTMFPMTAVDERQFVKQDLLGLRNLDTLQEFEKYTEEDIDWTRLDEKEHPDEMWEMLDKGLTLGIFQIEDGYARQLAKQFKPRNVEDIAILVALNRPGPIISGAPKSFITRRQGGTDDQFDGRDIPILKEILEPTYGWFLYQEQVIAYFTKLGYDLSDADAVRKILGKKKPEAMNALYHGTGEWTGKGYKDRASGLMGGQLALIVWEKIVGFAKYSFNKSHAIAYAALALRTLYAKWKDPRAFIIALLRTDPEKAGGYVSEGRRMNIKVLPPEMDRSDVDVAVRDDDIIFGFANVKGIGKQTARFICKLRESYDLTSPEKLHEAMDIESKQWSEADKETRPKRSPKQLFGANLYEALYNAGAWDKFEDRDVALPKRQALELELLKVILSDETEKTFASNGEALEDCDEWVTLVTESQEQYKVPGIVTHVKPKKTKAAGKPMGIITVEYEGDEAEFVVFPQQWQSYKFLWRERTPGIFNLKQSDRGLHFESGYKLS